MIVELPKPIPGITRDPGVHARQVDQIVAAGQSGKLLFQGRKLKIGRQIPDFRILCFPIDQIDDLIAVRGGIELRDDELEPSLPLDQAAKTQEVAAVAPLQRPAVGLRFRMKIRHIPNFWRASECSLYELDSLVDRFEDGRSSRGFDYETIACNEDILAGRQQNSIMPWNTTLRLQQHMASVKALF